MEEQDSYVAYEVSMIEESITDLGGAPLCWKDGREYRHAGWLRVSGGSCRFWLYRDKDSTLVAVRQHDSCEECIAVVRRDAAGREFELIDLRKSSSAAEKESCREPSSDARLPPQRAYSWIGLFARAA